MLRPRPTEGEVPNLTPPAMPIAVARMIDGTIKCHFGNLQRPSVSGMGITGSLAGFAGHGPLPSHLVTGAAMCGSPSAGVLLAICCHLLVCREPDIVVRFDVANQPVEHG